MLIIPSLRSREKSQRYETRSSRRRFDEAAQLRGRSNGKEKGTAREEKVKKVKEGTKRNLRIRERSFKSSWPCIEGRGGRVTFPELLVAERREG